jgi:hypothetical protein
LKRLILFLAIAMLTSPLALAGQDAYKKGTSVVRFLGGYGSTQEIPGTAEEYADPVDPTPPPPPDPPSGCHDDGVGECHGTGNDHYGNAEDTKHGTVGLGYSYFLAEDVSLELALFVPAGDAGTDNLGASAGLDYFFGHFYIPLQMNYRGDLDSLGFATGGGLDYRVGKATVLRGQITGNYVGDSDVDDHWGWQLGASIGWVLGANE